MRSKRDLTGQSPTNAHSNNNSQHWQGNVGESHSKSEKSRLSHTGDLQNVSSSSHETIN